MGSSLRIAFPLIMIFMLVSVLLCLTFVPPALACPVHERNYLLDVKAALVDQGKWLESWKGYNCCEWQDVGCSHGAGHVTRLALRQHELSGEIHSSLFKLEYLHYLDLSFNSFPAIPISSNIGNLNRLTFLDLSYAGFSGQIPPSLFNLSKLFYLDLSCNSLTGKIPPIGHLSALKWFNLQSNQLNGTIPSTISELVSLEFLDLSSNRLSGTISLSLFDTLPRLRQLSLSHNQLTVSIGSTWIPKFQIEILYLASCNLVEFPSFLVNQYYLGELDLSANNINGNIPTWLWDNPGLYDLNLSSNQFIGSLPSRLIPQDLDSVFYLNSLDLHNNSLHGTLPLPPPGVSLLDLSNNQFNGSIPIGFTTYLESTQVLSLSNNNLSGALPDSICTDFLMEVIDFSKNKLSGNIPPNFLRNCSGLAVLSLAENHLQGELPTFMDLSELQTLNLNGNRFQGTIPSSMANCSSLQVLDLGNNNLEGTVPQWIGNLTLLKILILKSNVFEGSISPKIFGLPSLQILDLSHNKISGYITTSLKNLEAMVNASQNSPREILSNDKVNGGVNYYTNQVTISTKGEELHYEIVLTNFKFMDLSDNSLSGEIPPEMGSLHGLISLNLSKNYLTGQIPKTLGGMEQLESLDLSVNKLNGTIPLELQSLNYLEALNLSYNMLEGKVPHGGQLLTFGESSFIGNAGLYDIPLTNTTGNSSSPHGDGNGDDGDGNEEEAAEIWWIVGVGISYVVGFNIVIGVLAFNFKVRKTVFSLYDAIIVTIIQSG